LAFAFPLLLVAMSPAPAYLKSRNDGSQVNLREFTQQPPLCFRLLQPAGMLLAMLKQYLRDLQTSLTQLL